MRHDSYQQDQAPDSVNVAPSHTSGPWHWRVYANSPDEVEMARKHGIEPVRMLTNEGQIALMAGTEDHKRVALIDCQTHFKRGLGYKTDCTERDANAHLIAAAPDLFDVAVVVAKIFHNGPIGRMARAAIARATGADQC